MNPSWNFAPTGGGVQGGISDALQELFDADHEKFIARETIQNSLDAVDDETKPVVVTFRRFIAPGTNIPGIIQLQSIMRLCHKYPPNKQQRAQSFFSKALLLARQPNISVLSIEDSNTKGITGSDYDYEDRWFRLIKSEGVSAQSSAAGGGSFGIGKGAPFAASSLRTVFYSTKDAKGDVAFQGVSRLTSYIDEEKITRQRVGFFGINPGGKAPDSIAIRAADGIPSLFKRNEKGTNIYVLGYYPKSSDWRKKLLVDVLQNCWAAIYDAKLEVNLVDNNSEPINITKASLEYLVENYQSEFKDERYNPSHYLRAWTHSDVTPIEGNLPYIGNVKLFISLDENGPKSIQWMRSPKIVVRPKNYQSIPIKYSGVFLCDDEKGNLILREMEPPDHRDWLPSKVENGNAIIKQINDWTIERIRELMPDQDEELLQIPDLGNILPDEDELPSIIGEKQDTHKEGEETNETNPRTHKEKESIKKIAAIFNASPGEEKRKINIGKHKIKKTENPEPEVEQNSNGAENLIDTTKITSFRSYRDDQSGTYSVILKSSSNISGSLMLRASGEDGDFVLPIERVSQDGGEELSSNGSRIKGLSIKENSPLKLTLKLKGDKRYKLSLKESHE